jgi:hypothetical protein
VDEAVANNAVTIAVEAATNQNLPKIRINIGLPVYQLAVKHYSDVKLSRATLIFVISPTS